MTDGYWRQHSRAIPRPDQLPTEDRDREPPEPLLRGIEQFNRREFFACHETLEELWHEEPGPVRVLYKGILQVGVGCYHLLRGNYRGAEMKLRTGVEYLQPFAPACQRVDVAALIHEASRLREAIIAAGPERLGDVDLALIPRVHLLSAA